MDVEQDELMMLVPPLFSIKDMPEDTVYLLLNFLIYSNFDQLSMALLQF
jgi:hypothetical protein